MSSWRSSSVDEVVLATFAEKGLLPPKEVVRWRVLHVAGFVTVYRGFHRDGAACGLLPANLLRASLVGGEDA